MNPPDPDIAWRALCEIGWKRADPIKAEFWVRWTSDDGLYFWLHPTENRWVGEPEQIEMPTFDTRLAATEAISRAPRPPFARHLSGRPKLSDGYHGPTDGE